MDEDAREANKEQYIRPLRQPYTTYAVLCESAHSNPDGSVDIHRIVNQWSIGGTDPPFGIQFWTAVSIKGLPADAPTQVLFRFIRDRDGMVVLSRDQEIRNSSGEINILSELPVFPVEEFGLYRFSVSISGQEIGAYPFTVVRMSASEAEEASR